jgi:hypothetical protein
MAESTSVTFASVLKLIPPFKVECTLESDAMDDACAKTVLESVPETKLTPLCLAEVAVEMPEESAVSAVCNPKTVLDRNTDADAIPLCRAEVAATIELPAKESADCSAVAMPDNNVDMEFTPVCLTDAVVETPRDTLVWVLCVEEMKADMPADTDATRLIRSDVADEMPADSVASASCSVEAAADRDADTEATAPVPMLAANAVSVAEIVEYSAGPASSVVAISNSVSSEAGGAPTKEVIAVNTWDDRFEICVLNAAEMDAAVDESVATLFVICTDNDETLAFLSDEATEIAALIPAVTICNEFADCAATSTMDETATLRAVAMVATSGLIMVTVPVVYDVV